MDSIPVFNKAIYPLLVLTQRTILLLHKIYFLGTVAWVRINTKDCFNSFNYNLPIVVRYTIGFVNCDNDMITLLKTYNASKLQILWHVNNTNQLKLSCRLRAKFLCIC